MLVIHFVKKQVKKYSQWLRNPSFLGRCFGYLPDLLLSLIMTLLRAKVNDNYSFVIDNVFHQYIALIKQFMAVKKETCAPPPPGDVPLDGVPFLRLD